MEEVKIERLDVDQIARSGKKVVEKQDELLARVDVEVSVVLGGAKIAMDRLLALSGGEVVLLNQKVGDAVELVYDGQVIARGALVAKDGVLGVRILPESDKTADD